MAMAAMPVSAGGWMIFATFFLALLVVGLVMRAARIHRGHMRQMLDVIQWLTAGRYTERADTTTPGELGQLARAINSLSSTLSTQKVSADQDRADLQALLNMLDHTNEPAIATDLSRRITSLNVAAQRALGHPRGALLHQLLDDAFPERELLDLYRLSQNNDDIIVRETRLPLFGRPATVQIILAPLLTENRRHGTFILIRDLTEIVQTMQMKTDFVSNASHELRTPLASIRAAVETINDTAMDDQRTTRRCVDIIESQVIRLQLLVQDLLDLSRTEDPRAVVRNDRLDLQEICDLVTSMFGSMASEKQVDLRVNLASDARSMRGDERLLTLLLKNLVDNALKFTTSGYVEIRSRRQDPAEATPSAHAQTVVLEVQDTGCGIPLEDQQRVFERFYTVNRSRGGADRGTGLGLAIVKHAVAAMGGHVQLESTPGEGTTMRCVFPIRVLDGAEVLEGVGGSEVSVSGAGRLPGGSRE
jgi:two-component system, OmpR family, phosphate regulon sensor histidine kinase PhoR